MSTVEHVLENHFRDVWFSAPHSVIAVVMLHMFEERPRYSGHRESRSNVYCTKTIADCSTHSCALRDE
jgi:hypothetical protein